MKSFVNGVMVLLLACLCNVSLVQAQSLPDFTVLVEQNVPAIVHVSTTRTLEDSDAEQQQNLEEFLRYFYGESAPDLELPPPPEEDLESGASGSGFIFSEDGYIVTNHHVVDGADTITITLNDQSEFDATLVGSDANSDLALLKIDATGLPVVKMGSSAKLKVGEWVLAIGSPFGLQYSVAAGIISYMGRSLPTEGRNYVSYIQTDVAINPGHSGGPLLNLAGEVVGINSQIFTNSGGSIGLSFAIPVDVASNVIAQLQDHGSVERGWLGVGYEDVSPSLAEAFNLDTPHGALINRVIEGSPAETAGLRAGDIVVAVDGQRIRTSADLPYFVGLLLPETVISMDLIRNGEEQTLALTLGTLESPELAVVPEEILPNRIGLSVRALEPEEKTFLAINQGVMVVAALGAAAEAGIQEGDVIITLDNVEIGTVDELNRVVQELPANKAIPILVARGEAQTFFTLRIVE